MGFWQFVLRRIVLTVPVLFIVSLATFVLAHAVPGDPVDAVIGERQSDKPEIRQRIEERYGSNKPLPVQYVYYLRNLLRGDLGETITTRVPSPPSLADSCRRDRAHHRLHDLCARHWYPARHHRRNRQDRLADNLSRFVALIGTSVPAFWLGLILSYFFSIDSRLLPGSGQLDVGMAKPPHVTGLISVDAVLAGQWDVLLESAEPPHHAVGRARLVRDGHHGTHAPFVAGGGDERRLRANRPR